LQKGNLGIKGTLNGFALLVVLKVVKGNFGVEGTSILNNFLGSWELLGFYFFPWGFKYIL
jgi:hypothetical protein